MTHTTEAAFEAAIEHSLLTDGGYVIAKPAEYHREWALLPQTVLAFIRNSQPQAWQRLSKIHGEAVEEKFFYRLRQELANRGTLEVLRQGITDYGVKLELAYFKPASGLNPDTLARYEQNILTISRQVRYSADHGNSLDVLLAINGLPVATGELKNPFTGQTVDQAKEQYATDRDPNDLLFQFKKRALVHFAIDPDEVWMTTQLAGEKTHFLPFNRGHNNGAGNPPNPAGYRTAYLWQEVWAKDSWLEIVGRFIHLAGDRLIFPRYHQLEVVRQLTAHAQANGPGHHYLIQHSAGSGKSNSIAWLAYRLASLHNADDRRVFDSVIVVTDRRVLDNQLQETIYQFEHKAGVVQKIDKDSQQLAAALTQGADIIITTLQKFPFILDKVSDLPQRNYAVIVDEAHSSQGGETAKQMKEALTVIDMGQTIREPADSYGNAPGFVDEEADPEDEIRKSMLARGRQPNLSFFGFTATPKAKTLEVFGTPNRQGLPEPFHLYSMRQAIEEGFILDVLQHYITYKTYFQLTKAIAEDPHLHKKKAARAIARFVSLHPHNLAQKVEIIVEHFRQCVKQKIGGQAKAMVVTASRPHVVRYHQAFKDYLATKDYPDIGVLVAFTPFVDKESGSAYTETDLNGFGESEVPTQFASPAYHLLVVAEKYQTGFDQPLLHTMYVDKKLFGVRAVQTLSRLNRTHPGKEDTFVLDFANTEEEILEAFQPYYEKTSLGGTADPNKLYDLKYQLDESRVIWPSEVAAFAQVFFKPQQQINRRDHAALNRAIDPAVDRFRNLTPEEKQDDFKNTLKVFVRLYAFLAQIMPFADVELEKFYAYARFLLAKLPKRQGGERLLLDDQVTLEYFRLEKISEGTIEPETDSPATLQPISEAGVRQDKDIQASLSSIIELLNDRFGTNFTEVDRYFFGQLEEALMADETLAQQAKNNPIDNFRYGFKEIFNEILFERMDSNQEIFARIFNDPAFGDQVRELLLRTVYQRLNEPF